MTVTSKRKGPPVSTVGTIPWEPMPETIEDEDDRAGYRAGAQVRARHRQRMAMRWRDKAARAEDKSKRRLPMDWHDWMMCQAEDGYASRWCTCDSPATNSPRDVAQRERQVRAALERELLIPIKERLRGVVPVEVPEPVAVEWVKTIDAPTSADTMTGLGRREHVRISQGLVAQESRLARSGARSLAIRAPASGKGPHPQPGRRSAGRLGRGLGLRVPSWLSRVRSYLSVLQFPGRTGG